MLVENKTFAESYSDLIRLFHNYPLLSSIKCRGQSVSHEFTNIQLLFNVSEGISIYSSSNSRAIPIVFVLAEWLWINSADNSVANISRFNKAMEHFSDDGVILNGAYGPRIFPLIFRALQKIKDDLHTRQAYIPIFQPADQGSDSKDIPCNTSLQFLRRDDILDLIVTSRSSDFITGLPIDAIHWQILLTLVRNYLGDPIKVGRVFYNLASLHIYEKDREQFEKWDPTIGEHTWKLPRYCNLDYFNRPLDRVNTFEDLLSIYVQRPEDAILFRRLEGIFQNRKFKVRR